jgi:hypothetical protein
MHNDAVRLHVRSINLACATPLGNGLGARTAQKAVETRAVLSTSRIAELAGLEGFADIANELAGP